jgi:hypothetical protein
MSSARGRYIRNSSYIIPIWRYIRNNAYMNELGDIPGDGGNERFSKS